MRAHDRPRAAATSGRVARNRVLLPSRRKHGSARMGRLLLAGSTLVLSGCGLYAASCLERQQTGRVTAFDGRVEAGAVASHPVPYDRRGSQNTVSIAWSGQGQPDGPRLAMYATPDTCTDFRPPPAAAQGPCAERVGSAGGTCARPGATCSDEDFTQTQLTVAKGPGNGPDDFVQYRIHVVGDPRQEVSYSISIDYFHGPDC